MLDCNVTNHPAEVEEKHCYLLLISMKSFTAFIYYLDCIFAENLHTIR